MSECQYTGSDGLCDKEAKRIIRVRRPLKAATYWGKVEVCRDHAQYLTQDEDVPWDWELCGEIRDA